MKSIDLTTAEEHPVVTTQEIWWDPKAGLVRDVDRVGGWITSDYVRNPCWISHGAPGRSQNFCIPPPPYFLKKSGFRWPLDSGAVVQTGRGTYHGHGVIWVVGLVNGRRPRDDFQRVGLDVRTHQPVVMQEVGRGRVINGYEVSSMDELPAKDVAFTVPKGGAPRNTPSESRSDEARGLDAARGALGTTPLWLGRSFRGSRLHRVAVGTEGALTEAGRLVEPARFVRFGYGSFTIEEYGSHRPFWLLEGPEPGVVLLNAGGPMSLSRDGLLVVASPRGASFRMDKATALALAKALRPLPAR